MPFTRNPAETIEKMKTAWRDVTRFVSFRGTNAAPTVDLSPAPGLRQATGPWREPIRPRQSLLAPMTFRLMNQTREIVSPGGWHADDGDGLWLEHLHACPDLIARHSVSRRGWHRSMLERWIDENPPGRGLGWATRPLALRIVHWIQWVQDGATPDSRFLDSLAVQVRWLRSQPSGGADGALLPMAKALIHAGLFFAGGEAGAWLERGLNILQTALERRILPDGGHAGRSPMIHAGILTDLLDLLNLAWRYPDAGVPPVVTASWREHGARMLIWLGILSHPDGGIAFFNDAVLDGAPELRELIAYARRLKVLPVMPPMPEGATPLAASGFVRMNRGPAVLLADVGSARRLVIPREAHAEALSFEFSLRNQRIVVNSGGCDGSASRGTAAHSTLVLDRTDSAPWAAPLAMNLREEGETLILECAHDGYRRLFRRRGHWRHWRLGEGELEIRDRVSGRWREAEVWYHLHPAIRVSLEEGGRSGRLLLPDGQAIVWEILQGAGELVSSTHHPRCGVSVANKSLRIPLTGPELNVIFRWHSGRGYP